MDDKTPEPVEAARVQLLEERPETQIQRSVVGQVVLRREVERRLEQVEVELTTETLIVRSEGEGGPAVWVNGEALEPGQELHIVLYREQPQVEKVVAVREEVRVLKGSIRERRSVPIELGREVLRVETEGDVRVLEGDDSQER